MFLKMPIYCLFLDIPVAEFKEFKRRFKLSRGLNMVGST